MYNTQVHVSIAGIGLFGAAAAASCGSYLLAMSTTAFTASFICGLSALRGASENCKMLSRKLSDPEGSACCHQSACDLEKFKKTVRHAWQSSNVCS